MEDQLPAPREALRHAEREAEINLERTPQTGLMDLLFQGKAAETRPRRLENRA